MKGLTWGYNQRIHRYMWVIVTINYWNFKKNKKFNGCGYAISWFRSLDIIAYMHKQIIAQIRIVHLGPVCLWKNVKKKKKQYFSHSFFCLNSKRWEKRRKISSYPISYRERKWKKEWSCENVKIALGEAQHIVPSYMGYMSCEGQFFKACKRWCMCVRLVILFFAFSFSHLLFHTFYKSNRRKMTYWKEENNFMEFTIIFCLCFNKRWKVLFSSQTNILG